MRISPKKRSADILVILAIKATYQFAQNPRDMKRLSQVMKNWMQPMLGLR
jgi:hypothetical protein